MKSKKIYKNTEIFKFYLVMIDLENIFIELPKSIWFWLNFINLFWKNK